jgi:hypothetical protein
MKRGDLAGICVHKYKSDVLNKLASCKPEVMEQLDTIMAMAPSYDSPALPCIAKNSPHLKDIHFSNPGTTWGDPNHQMVLYGEIYGFNNPDIDGRRAHFWAFAPRPGGPVQGQVKWLCNIYDPTGVVSSGVINKYLPPNCRV